MKNKINTKRLTTIGLLFSIMLFMSISGLGIIPLGFMNATTLHIPVILGAITGGPIVGAILGFFFGFISWFKNITHPSLFSFIFINPFISILPRILFGIMNAYLYKIFTKKDFNMIGTIVTAFLGSLTNTILILTSIYFIYGESYSRVIKISIDKLFKYLLGIGAINGIPEAIIATLIVVPIIRALFIRRRENVYSNKHK